MALPEAWAEATKSSAISCLDGPASATRRRLADRDRPTSTAAAACHGAIQGWWLWAPCASNWPATSDDRYAGPWDAKTESADPADRHPLRPEHRLPERRVGSRSCLGNAVLLTHDGYGHVSFKDPSACIEAARVQYLVDLVVPEPGTVCAADKKPFTN